MQQSVSATIRLDQCRGLMLIIRPKEWVKNSFVLAPLLFSGQLMHEGQLCKALFAVLLFCITSSAAYVFNDLYDVAYDSFHPVKSKIRPLAMRIIQRRTAYLLLSFLYLLLLTSWWFVPKVTYILLGYLVMNMAYTYKLKHQPVIDIFVIAIGFVFRVYAGAIAIEVPVSSWMLITTLCLALYLAAVKRRQELSQYGNESRKVLDCYSISLIERYAEMAGISALIFYSLFVMTAKPDLVITIPLVLFELFRYWYVVEVYNQGESPTDALFFDKPLLLGVIIWILISVWVVYA